MKVPPPLTIKGISLKRSNKVSLREIRDGVISLEELKEFVLKLIEFIVTLFIGLQFTLYILRPIYENYGIAFRGNLWVNWFGVAYLLFVLYTLIFGLLLFKGNNRFKQRLTSGFFWLLFIGSNYIVFVPFIKGENPF